MIPSDVQKVLNLSSSMFNHFREFLSSGLISYDDCGKRKVYFFTDEKSSEFIRNIFEFINDEQLQKDRAEFLRLKKGGHLQISGWSVSINYNTKKVKFIIRRERILTDRELKVHEINYISNLINRFSRAIKNKRKDQILKIKDKLDEAAWEDYPELKTRAEKLLRGIK